MRQTEPKIPLFTGPFASQCAEFITTKRAIGYKYESEVRVLESFDKMSIYYKDAESALTKELIEKFIRQKSNETPKSRANRVYVIREFAAFLTRLGIPSFIPEHRKFSASFIPYIFTEEEIHLLIDSADNIKPYHSSELAHFVYPVLFRVLYGCGLRVSEAINLRLKDVDLKNRILTIRNAKFGKDRIVAMSDTLTKTCADYEEKVHVFSNGESWFFPSSDKCRYSKSAIYSRFRVLLRNCGISHGGRGKGPRLHDLRHTFSVHCLNEWVRNNNDPIVLLPVLSAYLGHSRVSATEKYLRLIPQMNHDIIEKTQKLFSDIIPHVEPNLWEECENE